MAGEQAECLVECVRSKGGARRARLLAPDLLAIELEDRFGVIAQKRDFLFIETVLKEQIALLVEIFQLRGGKLHGGVPCAFPKMALGFDATLAQNPQPIYVPRNAGLRLA